MEQKSLEWELRFTSSCVPSALDQVKADVDMLMTRVKPPANATKGEINVVTNELKLPFLYRVEYFDADSNNNGQECYKPTNLR